MAGNDINDLQFIGSPEHVRIFCVRTIKLIKKSPKQRF